MITGETSKDIKEYRKIPRFSYSSLKLYVENRKKFYKEEILGDKKEKEETDFMRMGSVCDVLLTDKDNWEDYYIVSSANKPTGQLLTFTENVFKRHKINLDVEGNLTISTEQLFSEAYQDLVDGNGGKKLRDGINKFIERFDKEAADYYRELCLSEGKTVLTIEEVQTAERIVQTLKTAENTKDIVNAISGNEIEVFRKHPILFHYKGHDLKSELDQIIVNHEEKIIEIFDYKCTSFVEFFISSYLEYKYYLQQALYRIAAKSWTKQQGWEDYKVGYMNFIAFDQINYYKPIIVKMNSDNFEQGLNGFRINGRKYDGVNKILDDITYSIDSDIWDMSVDNLKNNGVVSIPVFDSYKTN